MRLSPDLHAELRLLPIDNAALAAQQPIVDLLITDIQPLAARFPIVVSALPNTRLQALVTPSDTENLFADHTPAVWRHYPLMLASMLGETSEATSVTAPDGMPALVVDTDAPHFQLGKGFRLFENGEPTPFLRHRITALQACAEDEARTRELIQLMHQAGILEPSEVDHQGERIDCFLVNDKALGANLDRIGRDKMGQIISLVLAIADSQKQLNVKRSTA